MVKFIVGAVSGFVGAVIVANVAAWIEDAGRAEYQQGLQSPSGWPVGRIR